MNNKDISDYQILFLTSRLPTHLLTGDRVRAYHLIKGLVNLGYTVDLLGFADLLSPSNETDIYSLCRKVYSVHREDIEFQNSSRAIQLKDMIVGLMHGFPRRTWQFHSPQMIDMFQGIINRTQYDVIHFSEVGVAELIKYIGDKKHIKIIYDLIDAISLSIFSSLKYQVDISYPFRLLEAYQLKGFEKGLVKKVNAALVVSSRDKVYLNNPSNLHVIPIGLELPASAVNVDKEFDLIFVGNMSTKTNIDAIEWFVSSVWPLVHDQRPQTTLYIVGREPSQSIMNLASDQIVITGLVEDVNWYYARARVCIAPIRYGSGQKTKLLEAFSNSLPVVATNEANQGLGAQDGVSIILKDDPDEMAKSILQLLENDQLRQIIGKRAYQFVRENFSLEHSASLLSDLYVKVMENARINPEAAN